MPPRDSPSTPQTRRRQIDRRAATRRVLLASAVSAVLEGGTRASIGEIADRAGVSKGALQHHFDSKSDLLVAVTALGWNDLVERLGPIAETDGPMRMRLHSLVSAMWASYQHPTTAAALMISTDRSLDDATAHRVRAVFEVARSTLDELWRAALAGDDIDPDVLDRGRRFARDHLTGLAVQQRLDATAIASDDDIEVLCDALEHLLGLTEPTAPR